MISTGCAGARLAPFLLNKETMITRTIILASFSMLLALPSAWAGPLTPEHAWRQMQGAGSRRRVTMPRTNRPLYTTPQVNSGRTRSTSKTVKPVTQKQTKPAKKNGQGWLSKLKTKLTSRKAAKVEDKAKPAETGDAQKTPRSRSAGRYMGLARVKLTSLWSGMVGGIYNLIASYKQRREAREAAFQAIYWRQPMIVPAGSPIPAEVLVGGMRLHKLQNYSQGTLSMLYRSGLVTGAEFRILTEARMGLPQMMQQMPQGEAQQAAAPEAQPQMPPPPQQQIQ